MPGLEPRDGRGSPIRLSDLERNDAQERLSVFFSEGRLTHAEYSARLDEVYAARTDLELAVAFRGLPRPAPAGPSRFSRADLRIRAGRAMWISSPAGLCTVIWAMTTSNSYFWPEWVWLPTALAVLGSFRISARKRRRTELARRAERDAAPLEAGPHDGREILTTVFVDIAGSTEKAAALGDRSWSELLRRFELLVEHELVEHHGRKLFTKGDEVVATFRSPAHAIAYGRSLHHTIGSLQLQVRTGIHTGEIEGRDSELTGIALHIGQRVSASAAPGEILVSSTVRDLVHGSGIPFTDRGDHELKGIAGTWHLYAVVTTGQEQGGRVVTTGRVVLITGASAGIGLSAADQLHQKGWQVIGASRRGTAARDWTSLVMDVDEDESVRRGIEQVVAAHGRLDALVTCAGWGLAGAVEHTPIAQAKYQLETNFWGTVRVVQAALPIMRQQGGGRLVLVTSIGGLIGIPFQAFYSASKFALEGYGEALAYEVAPFGIAVTLVEPGNVRTDFTASRRTVGPLEHDDPYAAATAKAVGLMERDEANGVAPDDAAASIVDVLDHERPRRRVSVGKMGERVGLIAKRLLPYRLFERGAKSSLGV